MKNIIVGTAGHVDHGKTCLIKALTGMNTDRLKEEQKRGITIENGFADMLYGDYNISIIDVPGHERFIKNMLAGIGGIDIVLLVIGLDEGVMPQTVEHFRILEMLDIRRGIIVLTKRDLVDDEDWVELVKDDAMSLVEGTFLEGAPMIEVSAFDGMNIDALKGLITETIDQSLLKNEADALFRLPVDRVFTIDGFGTVVTGTLMEGTLHTGEEMMLYPDGKPAKARNVQVHNEAVDAAFAGQRTAINVAGLKKEDMARGSVLARKDSMEPTMMLDVRLEVFRDTEREILNNSRVHFYCGSTEGLGKVVLLDRDVAVAGDQCYAQIRLETPVAVKKDDRFIIRFYSPLETIGGGKILEVTPPKHKRNQEAVLEALAVKDLGSKAEVLELIIKEKCRFLMTKAMLAAKLNLSEEEATALLEGLCADGRVKLFRKDVPVHQTYLQLVEDTAKEVAGAYHQANAMSLGMNKEEFKSRLMQALRLDDGKFADELVADLVACQVLQLQGKTVALHGFTVKYTPEMEKMRARIKKLYQDKGYEMPLTEDVLAGEKDAANARHILDALVADGTLIRLNYQYCIDREAFEAAFLQLKEKIQTTGQITLGEFRDIIGTSRKYAIEILDYLDREKITVKVDDVRVLK